eukprot:CAMPEP_0176214098 /NCGR_PEP_ID=MMETSP0121_2-20121125/15995_1 /TAXON_ID=160619 /ORGANISM="Kryptoperidinium foliaceum, Strain CCMP 1326" /LENGTH=78 /DNA_ID=CAMNT_0017553173 /DNA_START=391 /DNA_END=627 /DNA_ORIENTATION=-
MRSLEELHAARGGDELPEAGPDEPPQDRGGGAGDAALAGGRVGAAIVGGTGRAPSAERVRRRRPFKGALAPRQRRGFV